MALLEILHFPDPRLRLKAKPVAQVDEQVRQMVNDMFETMIDIAISPQQVTIGALLAHIRRGDVVAVHSLRKGSAEAIEAVAHGKSCYR